MLKFFILDGKWHIVGNSKCECDFGYIPSLKTGLCTGKYIFFLGRFLKDFNFFNIFLLLIFELNFLYLILDI